MAKNNESISAKKALKERLSDACYKLTRLYDHSLTSAVLKKLRSSFFTLGTRTLGVFFLVFGIYSFVISLLIRLFTSRPVDSSNIYGGIICAILSLPLVLSKGNLSTILRASAFGDVICDYLNIRRETLPRELRPQHLTVSFVLGVVLAAATVVFPLPSILCALFFLLLCSMILSSPETGLLAFCISLFLTGEKTHYFIIAVTAVSYVFKLIRRKRYLTTKKADALTAVFALSTLGAVLFTTGNPEKGSALKLILMVPYFMAVFLLRDGAKITKVLTAAIICTGTLCSLFVLGNAIIIITPQNTLADPEYLAKLIENLPLFASGFAPIAVSALIPLSAAFIIKPRSEGHRFTLILCLAAMGSYLFMSEKWEFALCAFIATALLLLITGARWVYLALALVLSSTVILTFAGSFGDRLFGYIYRQIYEAYHQAELIYSVSRASMDGTGIFYGSGFLENADYGNFYYSILSSLGLVGFIVFLCIILTTVFQASALTFRTFASYSAESKLYGLRTLGEKAETRMGIVSVTCSLISLLISATFFDLYSNNTAYMFLFLVLGICTSYVRSTESLMSKTASTLEHSGASSAGTVIKRGHN